MTETYSDKLQGWYDEQKYSTLHENRKYHIVYFDEVPAFGGLDEDGLSNFYLVNKERKTLEGTATTEVGADALWEQVLEYMDRDERKVPSIVPLQ